LLLAGACSSDEKSATTTATFSVPSNAVDVRVDPARVTGRLAERYLGWHSIGRSPTTGSGPSTPTYSISPVLRRLVAALGPTVLRVWR
jgi:hypothetical protein